jgi:adenine-specific DNA-methyltransferase
LPRTEKQNALYKYDDKDGKGLWRPDNLTVKTYSEEYDYPIINPTTGREYFPTKGRCWATNKDTMKKWIDEKRVFF